MELTDDDVLEILKLFEQSRFDFLQLEQGERKITVSKGGYVPAAPAMTGVGSTPSTAVAPVSPPGARQAAQPAVSRAARAEPVAPSAQPAAPPAQTAVSEDALVTITAPMVGKFYSAPAPSDPPYVEVGSKVAAGATVGLIEVMKVFTSIKTECAGVIERILVTNGDFVEFGQPLFLLRPESASQS